MDFREWVLERIANVGKESTLYLTFAQLLAKYDELENSSTVKVMHSGATYPSYDSWVKKNFPEYLPKFKKGHTPNDYGYYNLIGKALHNDNSDAVLCLIETLDKKQVYVIGNYGIEHIVSIPKTKKVFSLEKWLKLDIGSSLRKTSLEQGWPMRCDGKTKEEEIVLSNWSYDQDVWDEVEVK